MLVQEVQPQALGPPIPVAPAAMRHRALSADPVFHLGVHLGLLRSRPYRQPPPMHAGAGNHWQRVALASPRIYGTTQSLSNCARAGDGNRIVNPALPQPPSVARAAGASNRATSSAGSGTARMRAGSSGSRPVQTRVLPPVTASTSPSAQLVPQPERAAFPLHDLAGDRDHVAEPARVIECRRRLDDGNADDAVMRDHLRLPEPGGGGEQGGRAGVEPFEVARMEHDARRIAIAPGDLHACGCGRTAITAAASDAAFAFSRSTSTASRCATIAARSRPESSASTPAMMASFSAGFERRPCRDRATSPPWAARDGAAVRHAAGAAGEIAD